MMNLEIRQKFDNFVKVIEKKEKEEWLKQTNNHIKYIPDLLVFNPDVISPNDNINIEKQNRVTQEKELNCECEISDGYSSFEKSIGQEKDLFDKKNKDTIEILTNNSENSLESFKINYMGGNKILCENKKNADELSLLEDDYILDKVDNSVQTDKDAKIIKPELKDKFKINDLRNKRKTKENNSSDIGKKLEKTYDKILFKNEFENKNLQKTNQYELINYLIKSKDNNQGVLSNLNEFVEFIFTESTRGWNYDSNIYIFNIEKFKENLNKIIVSQENSNFKFGLIYRDYSNPKVFMEKDFSKGWVGIDCVFESGKTQIFNRHYTLKDKILYYCFKNLVKSSKFKKRIGSTNYKFIKKTIQIYGNKDLIIDIIFYIGFKIN